METELVEMPIGLIAALKHVLRISETPGPNGAMVELIQSLDGCRVMESPEMQAVHVVSGNA
jgi:hypothetical protein